MSKQVINIDCIGYIRCDLGRTLIYITTKSVPFGFSALTTPDCLQPVKHCSIKTLPSIFNIRTGNTLKTNEYESTQGLNSENKEELN